MSIPGTFGAKELSRINGKSIRQCERDLSAIKRLKSCKKPIVTISDAAAFYGITEEFIKSKFEK